MVASLGPVVDGAESVLRRVALVHLGGLLVGAISAAAALALIGSAVARVGGAFLLYALVWTALAASVAQLFGLGPLQSGWQVPERWRRMMDLDVLAFAYGLLLGFGVLTAVVVSVFWIFVTLTLLVEPAVALAGWIAYASARGLSFWISARKRSAADFVLARGSRQTLVTASLVLGAITVTVHLGG